MAKRNIIIVGNGLFGSIAATLARAEGHTVTVVSNLERMAASSASGCVLAPSWLSSLDKPQIERAMGVLSSLYKVEELEFKTNLIKTFKAKRVNPDDVLVTPDVTDTVTGVYPGMVRLASGQQLKGYVLVAAGVWSGTLVDMPAIRALYGASLRFKGQQLPDPRISVYAPYKQAVAFNLNKRTVWMGDGTALIGSTWDKDSQARIDATKARAAKLFKLTGQPEMRVGARPYVEGFKSGYFKQVAPKTWVSTGGAKNGTVLAAWQAHEFLEAIK